MLAPTAGNIPLESEAGGVVHLNACPSLGPCSASDNKCTPGAQPHSSLAISQERGQLIIELTKQLI